MGLDRAIAEIWQTDRIRRDLHSLCDAGGRLAGTESELAARAYLLEVLTEISDRVRVLPFEFEGWAPVESTVLTSTTPRRSLESTPLLMSPASPSGGVDLEVLDLGRGAPEDFIAAADDIPGRAVLVRHEFPFTTGHVHRGRKYRWAKSLGASAFLIGNNIPGCGVVSGFCGRGDADDIPAAGIALEGAERLRDSRTARRASVRLEVRAEKRRWRPENLCAEIPAESNEWVVLCAHYDGHLLAESAMDNASGVAAALGVARSLAGVVPRLRCGLRILLFTVEEWGLRGSEHYVASLSKAERRLIRLVVNLDTVVGHPRLSALTCALPDVERFVTRVGAMCATTITPVRPVLANSDHYNFFMGGVPALRLIAGYEEADARTRYLLTPADMRDKVPENELRSAAAVAARLVYEACAAEEPPSRFRERDEVTALRARTDPAAWDERRRAELWTGGRERAG